MTHFPDNATLLSFWSPASLAGNITLLLHLIGSMLLGMLVGYERSYHGRAAGMRTFSLVCISKLVFDMFQTVPLDNRLNMQKTFHFKD